MWIFVLWVCWSRIAVGAHFPADVLGGALVGLVCALAAHWLAKLWVRASSAG
ncbi:MAG: phosphatase PAP2 family protein [Thiomonas sp.]